MPDAATDAYAPLPLLLAALRQGFRSDSSEALLRLALRCTLHPDLVAHRADPTLALNGDYPALDVLAATLETAVSQIMPDSDAVGIVGATLYLPAFGTVTVCRVCAAYLPATPQNGWSPVVVVHPVSTVLHESAQKAFDAALHVLLFARPGNTPPIPAPLFWGIDGIDDATASGTVGDSLQLPLALAFVSALSKLPVAATVGATGAMNTPDTIAPVGFTGKKRAAFCYAHGEAARFLTVSDGATLAEIVPQIGDAWQTRFKETHPVPTFYFSPNDPASVLCVQIENAATFWDTVPGVFRGAVEQCHALWCDAVTRHGGEPFGTPSTEMSAVFALPQNAVSAGTHFLQAVRSARWDAGLGERLPVRAGVHHGQAERTGASEWRGAAVVQAAQIASAASAGQLLASDVVQIAVAQANWLSFGAHRLRDLTGFVTLFEVAAPGLPTVGVPPESLETVRHNLPTWDTPLIGREHDAEAVLTLLETERLVTLTGVGGVGKTRLAARVAAQAVLQERTKARFRGGAFVVAVDETGSTEATLADAVCAAVGVPKLSALSSLSVLLLLDNAEGAAQTVAAFVKNLLASAPGVCILVTSRRVLGVRGEKRFVVSPLSVSGDAALTLFLQRARTATGDPDFDVITDADLGRSSRRRDSLDF